MILRVGLTGGIASGKSTISRTFERLGAAVIDADAIVSRLYEPGGTGHAELVREYGEQIIAPDGTIDRVQVSALAFRDESSAQRLNTMIHPLVAAEEERQIAAIDAASGPSGRVVIVEATLLLEAGGKSRYDAIVVADIPAHVQVARGVARGMDETEVRRRMLRQMSREARLRQADFVIDNSALPEVTEARTSEVFESLAAMLASRLSPH